MTHDDKLQLSLLDPVPPFSREGTSKAAAVRIMPDAKTLRGIVLDFIRAAGARGATDDEMQLALAMEGHTQTPRRWELERAGFIRDSGLRRKTRKKRQAIVWVWESGE